MNDIYIPSKIKPKTLHMARKHTSPSQNLVILDSHSATSQGPDSLIYLINICGLQNIYVT